MGASADATVFYGIFIGDDDGEGVLTELSFDDWLYALWRDAGEPFGNENDWLNSMSLEPVFGGNFYYGWTQTYVAAKDSVQVSWRNNTLKLPSSYELQLWHDKLSVFADLAGLDISDASMKVVASYG